MNNTHAVPSHFNLCTSADTFNLVANLKNTSSLEWKTSSECKASQNRLSHTNKAKLHTKPGMNYQGKNVTLSDLLLILSCGGFTG